MQSRALFSRFPPFFAAVKVQTGKKNPCPNFPRPSFSPFRQHPKVKSRRLALPHPIPCSMRTCHDKWIAPPFFRPSKHTRSGGDFFDSPPLLRLRWRGNENHCVFVPPFSTRGGFDSPETGKSGKRRGKEKQRKGLCRHRSIYERAGMSSKEKHASPPPLSSTLYPSGTFLSLLLLLVSPPFLPLFICPPFTLYTLALTLLSVPLLFEGGP